VVIIKVTDKVSGILLYYERLKQEDLEIINYRKKTFKRAKGGRSRKNARDDQQESISLNNIE